MLVNHYLITIDLEGANGITSFYNKLNDLMLSEGFSNKIVAKSGDSYILPQGKFYIESDKNTVDISLLAKRVASKLLVKNAVVVSLTNDLIFYGLEKSRQILRSDM
ncbi:hypothetical protein ACFOWM_13645 [Ferruginibacter yonginensis]|uniref:Uncharacterized protein n=1 Tax=Ferruginibacter yonginensis TaxID=1310416 RepID=A0ABV8QW09_9BACT